MAKAEPITGLNAQAPTHENARIIARAKMNDFYRWQEYANQPYAQRELHNMRIAAKRLRYTLEIFEDFLPSECKNVRTEMEQFQEELGELHDSDVMIMMLRLCLARKEGAANEQALLVKEKKQAKASLPPDLLPILLDSKVTPGSEQRYGLEQLLKASEQERVRRYEAFYQHWKHSQEQDFQRHLSEILDQ